MRKSVFAFLLLLFMPISGAYALGLADIELRSNIDEPLDARIPLRALQASDMETLRVKLADTIHFTRSGLERSPILDRLRFKAARNTEDGSAYIRINTDEAVNEPFLSFIIEVSWSRGRILREYTLLIDPPIYADTGSTSVREVVTKKPDTAPVQAREAGKIRKPSAKETPRSGSAPAPTTATTDTKSTAASPAREIPSQYGPVVTRDTLWSIATRFRPDDSVTIEQVMLALQRENPQAFSQNNINALKAGSILRIPDLQRIKALSRRQAFADVKSQHAAWEDIRQKLARNPAAAPEGSPLPSTEAGIDANDPNRSGRVEILSAGTAVEGIGQAGKDGIKKLRTEVTMMKEEIGAKSRENLELKARIAEAEGLIREFANLMEIQSDEITALKRKLAEKQAEAERTKAQAQQLPVDQSMEKAVRVDPLGTAEPPPHGLPGSATQLPTSVDSLPSTPVEKPTSPSQIPPAEPVVKPLALDRNVETTVPSGEKLTPPAAQPTPQAVVEQSRVPAPSSEKPQPFIDETVDVDESSFMDLIEANIFLIVAILGGIIVVFFVWLQGRTTTKKANIEQDIDHTLTSVPQAPDPHGAILHSNTIERPPAQEPKVVASAAAVQEAPPAQEAKPAQVEKTEPVQASRGSDAQPAQKPAPVASSDSPAESAQEADIILDAGFENENIDTLFNLEPAAASTPEKANQTGNLNPPTGTTADQSDTTMPPTSEWALDFSGPDLEEIPEDETSGDSAKATPDTPPEDKGLAGENMDFDFGFGLDAEPFSGSSTEKEYENRLADFPSTDASGGIDEIQTKLDLAQAYIDMGDVEGAKTILDKVLKEGSQTHKDLAKKLMEKFG